MKGCCRVASEIEQTVSKNENKELAHLFKQEKKQDMNCLLEEMLTLKLPIKTLHREALETIIGIYKSIETPIKLSKTLTFESNLDQSQQKQQNNVDLEFSANMQVKPQIAVIEEDKQFIQDISDIEVNYAKVPQAEFDRTPALVNRDEITCTNEIAIEYNQQQGFQSNEQRLIANDTSSEPDGNAAHASGVEISLTQRHDDSYQNQQQKQVNQNAEQAFLSETNYESLHGQSSQLVPDKQQKPQVSAKNTDDAFLATETSVTNQNVEQVQFSEIKDLRIDKQQNKSKQINDIEPEVELLRKSDIEEEVKISAAKPVQKKAEIKNDSKQQSNLALSNAQNSGKSKLEITQRLGASTISNFNATASVLSQSMKHLATNQHFVFKKLKNSIIVYQNNEQVGEIELSDCNVKFEEKDLRIQLKMLSGKTCSVKCVSLEDFNKKKFRLIQLMYRKHAVECSKIQINKIFNQLLIFSEFPVKRVNIENLCVQVLNDYKQLVLTRYGDVIMILNVEQQVGKQLMKVINN